MKNLIKLKKVVMPSMSLISHLDLKDVFTLFIPPIVLATVSIFLFFEERIIVANMSILLSVLLSLAPIYVLILRMKLKRFFKKEDFEFLKQVLFFLKDYGLEADLRGGAKLNFLKGNQREYNDIDLAVKTDGLKLFSPEYRKYVEAIQELTRISGGKKYLDWKIEDETEGFAKYVGLDIEFKFRIKSQKTETSIDLSFGESTKDLRGKEGSELPISSPSLMYFTQRKKD